jgi:hypothetical protein
MDYKTAVARHRRVNKRRAMRFLRDPLGKNYTTTEKDIVGIYKSLETSQVMTGHGFDKSR